MLQHSAELIDQHAGDAAWHGRRVLALDGTTLRLPNVPECAQAFGRQQPAAGSFRPLARASALWDVRRCTFVDAVLCPYAQDERSMAQQHLPVLTPQDLVVMDRGYPSRALLQDLLERSVSFCAQPQNRM